MAHRETPNRRQAFRVDDMLPLRDRPLSTHEFEQAKTRIGIRSRQAALLRQMLGRDIFNEELQQELPNEVARALEMLDAKLDYLIGLNMLNDASHYALEERPVNMSTTGCSFTTNECYKSGDPLEVVVMLPSFPPTILELIGEVVWTKPEGANRWRIGVRFFFRNDEEEQAIAQYVFRRHRELIRLRKRAEEQKAPAR